ncbi:MAG TPA: hypothetical protein VIQ51_18445 [Chryseosolibacter sp.]|jgi:hypothetical protein
MKTFNLFVDRKVSVWNREYHEIKAKSKENAIKILTKAIKKAPLTGTSELPSYTEECETLYDSEEAFPFDTVHPTIQIVDENDATLWDNTDQSQIKIAQ